MMTVQKLKGKTYNMQVGRIELLKRQFPQIFSEGKINPEKQKLAFGEKLDTNNKWYTLPVAGKNEYFRHTQETTILIFS